MGLITLVSIDPGLSSGITVGTFSATEPWQLQETYQVEDGLKGLTRFLQLTNDGADYFTLNGVKHKYMDTIFVCEKFTPRPNPTGGIPLKSVEPLLCEGYLVSQGVIPYYEHDTPNGGTNRWRAPINQYFAGGNSLGDRKKRANSFLKRHELYRTGKQVGCKDAHDANSATLHSLGWLRTVKHLPTLNKYFKGHDENK